MFNDLGDHNGVVPVPERVLREWRLFRQVVTECPIPFCVYDEQDRLIAWNDAYASNHAEAFAHYRDVLGGESLRYRDLVRFELQDSIPSDELAEEIDKRLAKRRDAVGFRIIRQYAKSGYQEVLRYRLAEGGLAGIAIDVNDLVDANQRLSDANERANASLQELEAARETIEKLAYYDELTGLANRHLLRKTFDELRQSTTSVGMRCLVLHIDLDKFKKVNDNLGHAAGDYVLKRVADILLDACGADDLAVRLGGDEFLVLMLDDGVGIDAKAVAEGIVEHISQPMQFNGTPCRVGASIGVTEFQVEELELDDVLDQSDLATYSAKEQGRGCVVHFDRALRREIKSRKTLTRDIRAAVEHGQFEAYYQPQFRCSDTALVGFEVLCRWLHPDGRILTPEHFFETATALSLIGEIDRCMFAQVQQDLANFSQAGVRPPKLSLNVSYERLFDESLVADMAELGELCDLSLELNEAQLCNRGLAHYEVLQQTLAERGVVFEIDRFGRAPMSLSGLISLRPSALKIDPHIILPALHDESCRATVNTIVNIGKSAGIDIVAEGVQTMAHVTLVRELGCDFMQGYALAEPLPAKSLVADYKSQLAFDSAA